MDACAKYFCTEKDAKATIEKYGCAIVPSVLSQRECDAMVDEMWRFLEHITSEMSTPIKREDEASWKTFYELSPSHSMLLQHWQVGHAQFVWDLRQNPKLVGVFSAIWDTKADDLLVSFDGAAFHLPSEVTNRGHYRGNNWLHTDQSFTNSKFSCVQSWVTGLDVRPGDATLTFLEGSNNLHGEFAKTLAVKSSDNWYKLNTEQMAWFTEKGCNQVDVVCPPGSLVLWDSRTIHAGKEALRHRAAPNFRCVVYLCYTPRKWMTDAHKKKKIDAFENLRMTTHWPHKIKLFGLSPQTYGKARPRVTGITAPMLNELGRRLAGH